MLNSFVIAAQNPDMILTASRDKTIFVWQLTREDVSGLH